MAGTATPPSALERKIQELIARSPKRVVGFFLFATALAVAGATGTTIDPSIDRLMIQGDALRELDRRAKEEFGNDEVMLVAFDLGRPYTADDLRKLRSISGKVAALPGVGRVRDLSNTEDVRSGPRIDSQATLDASPLVKFDTVDQDIDAIRARTREHRLYNRILVSKDQTALGMVVYPSGTEGGPQALNKMTGAVDELIEREAAPWPYHYAGYPYTAYEVNRIIRRDLAVLTPVVLVTIGAILYFATGRLFPLGLLLALIGWVALNTLAFLAMTGKPLNVVVSTVPSILNATSAAYVIYSVGLLARVGPDQRPGVALVPLLYKPVLLSALSTAIGFASLRLIDVQAIGDFGIGLAFGICTAALGTLLLIPALIEVYDLRIHPRRILALESISQVGVRWAQHPWRVVAVAALLLAAAAPGITRVVVHTDTISYFAPDNRVRSGGRFFAEKLSSGYLLNFVFRTPEPGGALEPEVLELAASVAERLESNPNVDRTTSMLDYFRLIDGAMRPAETPHAVPPSREAAAQYLLLYESSGDPSDYERFINFDRSALAMLVPMHGGSAVYIDTAKEIEGFAHDRVDGIEVNALGSTFLYSRAMDGLTRGIVRGLVTAIALIGIVMLLVLRSVRLSAVALIPNVTPILLCAGTIGWLDIPLAMGTSVVGCITLGLAVDDTAHVMGHIDRNRTLKETYRVVGPPVILTTIAVGLGFAVMLLSEFQSVQALGIATAVTLTVALAADLLLLPSLLVLIGYRTGLVEAPAASADDPDDADAPGQEAAA